MMSNLSGKSTTRTAKVFVLSFVFVVLLSGCKTATGPAPELQPGVSAAVESLRDTHENLQAVLWVQAAAEYRSLALTVFAGAEAALELALVDTGWTAATEQTGSYQDLPPAVILDIDETVLDNSLFQGQLVKDRSSFSDDLWKEWVLKEDATFVPGALEFIRSAEEQGVTVFFVTNRTADLEEATRSNLINLGLSLPVGLDTLLTKGEAPNNWASDKKARRAFIAQSFRILLLIGDDLGDFIEGSRDSPENRVRLADKYSHQWGSRWFMLPNPLYGSWESSLYGNDYSLPVSKVLRLKHDQVKSFK